jgi:hypothetical protein
MHSRALPDEVTRLIKLTTAVPRSGRRTERAQHQPAPDAVEDNRQVSCDGRFCLKS